MNPSITCVATSILFQQNRRGINTMTTDLVTYLSFDGQCEAAFKHYEKILGGKILMMARYADAPAEAGVQQTPETANRIMHARLQVGERFLMGGDAPPQFASKPQGFCVSIQVDDPAEAEHIFRGLGEGGVIQMPIGETFWARRFGMLIDKFGTPWMVNCERLTT
jgi:PhnB protein